MTYPEILNNVLQSAYVAFVTVAVWGALLFMVWLMWEVTNWLGKQWVSLMGGWKEFYRYCRWLKTDAGKEWERNR